MTTWNLATIETPTRTITKARIEFGDATATAFDRRTGAVLATFAVPNEPGPNDRQFALDGDVFLTKTGGCACGGTVVTEKASV